jgi:hypothetical protein
MAAIKAAQLAEYHFPPAARQQCGGNLPTIPFSSRPTSSTRKYIFLRRFDWADDGGLILLDGMGDMTGQKLIVFRCIVGFNLVLIGQSWSPWFEGTATTVGAVDHLFGAFRLGG